MYSIHGDLPVPVALLGLAAVFAMFAVPLTLQAFGTDEPPAHPRAPRVAPTPPPDSVVQTVPLQLLRVGTGGPGGCGMDFARPENGEPAFVLAQPDACAQARTLVGRDVVFSFREETVYRDACEGERTPECYEAVETHMVVEASGQEGSGG